jgi:hypothetical protein
MKYYPASIPIQTTPKNGYIAQEQAFRDSWWTNTSTITTIQEETSFGSGTWQNVDVQLFSVSQAKTTTKLSDDYKEIQFKDLSHTYDVGYKYQISSVVWLSITDKSIIRKCNNTLKWIYNSVLVTEPCVIEDVFSKIQLDKDKHIDLQQGQILVRCQRNNNSSNISNSDRFIFNGEAFKIIDKSYIANSNLMNLIMEFTQTQEDDDLINNIADTSKNNYRDIVTGVNGNTLSPEVDSIVVGTTQTFTIRKYVSSVANSNTFSIAITGVPSANYTLTPVGGLITACNSFTIRNNAAYSTNKLTLTCTNNADSSTKIHTILLTGRW